MPRISSDVSDEDASSDYDSDSGSSDHPSYGIFNEASQEDGAASQGPGFNRNVFAPRPSPPPQSTQEAKASHVPEQPLHGEKRKNDDSGDQEHLRTNGAKSRRLRPSRPSTSASQSNASGAAGNGYDHDDDDNYPEPDAAAAATDPAPAFPKKKTSPQTGAQLFAKHFPHLNITGKAKTHILAARPVLRTPTIVRTFNADVKPQNVAAWLMQATGELLAPERSCARCQQGNGVFGRDCVVMADDDMKNQTHNTCANCWYNRNGFCCSVRFGNEGKVFAGLRKTYVGEREKPVPPPPSPPSPPVHPSYTEPFPGAVAAAGVLEPVAAAAPATNGDFPTTAVELLTAMGQPPTIPTAAAAAPKPPQENRPWTYGNGPLPEAKPSASPSADSRDGKVGSWEKRYELMGTAELLEMQRVLVERLEDTTMRMVAMQKVLVGRQTVMR